MSGTHRWLERARLDPAAVADEVRASSVPDDARAAALALRAAGAPGVEALLGCLNAEDRDVRAVVVEAVALLPANEALGPLRDRVDLDPDPWVRRVIARAAGRLRGDAARDALGRWVWSPRPEVAGEALRALRERGWLDGGVVPGAAGALANALRTGDAELAWHAGAALTVAPLPSAEPDLRAWAGAEEPYAAAQATRALSALGVAGAPCPPAASLTLDAVLALREEDAGDRATAVLVARYAADRAAVSAALGRVAVADDGTEPLAMAARHPLPEVRQTALAALERRVGDRVWRAYDEALRDEVEPPLRRGLLWALGRRSEPATLDRLCAQAQGAETPDRPIAVASLVVRVRRSARGRSEAVLGALMARLIDGTSVERALAAEGLGRFAAPDVAQALLRATGDPEEAVRAAARAALARSV